jgi:hypothetical protein
MAQLHVTNLHTWRGNDFAVHEFDKCEMDQLESELGSIASGGKEAGVVYNTAKRIIARRK